MSCRGSTPAAGRFPRSLRFPQRLSQPEFLAAAYPLMLLSRRMEERLLELFQKGYVKGTVTMGDGNEATAAGFAMPLRPGRDVVSLLHRDFAAHLLLGATPYELFCQYMANAESPTHGREGNCHHGDAARRRLPMISHLGKMLSLVVGGTWAARREGEDIFGLAVIGDGGSSTGEFHESLNLASVRKVPVLFLIENNHYSFSTPTSFQYHCRHLADRAHGYGITGQTINGLDAWEVYSSVCDALEVMQATSLPAIIECMTLRLHGHAAYDKGDYVPAETMRAVAGPRSAAGHAAEADGNLRHVGGGGGGDRAGGRGGSPLGVGPGDAGRPARPDEQPHGRVRRGAGARPSSPIARRSVKNGEAVGRALDYLLENNPQAFLLGLDVGMYGSAFKTCKGLIERHGAAAGARHAAVRVGAWWASPWGLRKWAPSRSSSSSSPTSRPRPYRSWD